MPKRIVICLDGTWNTPDQKSGGEYRPSNVVKTARAIAPKAPDGTHQVVYYDKGVGTGNLLDRLTGGAFGSGLETNIEDAYRFLMHNYDEGDTIFFFGFSRGAYTARSTAGLLRNSGLLHKKNAVHFPKAYELYRSKTVLPTSPEAIAFRAEFSREVTVSCMCVWDTVGALGIPIRGLRYLTKGRHAFHDVELSSSIRNGFQALAIDERRTPFTPAIWQYTADEGRPKPGQVIAQVWFAGVHSDAGGGYHDTGLSDVAFAWMKDRAEGCGLAFDEDYILATIHPKPFATLHDSMTGPYAFTWGKTRALGDQGTVNEAVHRAVVERYERDDAVRYAPDNLVAYMEGPSPKIAM